MHGSYDDDPKASIKFCLVDLNERSIHKAMLNPEMEINEGVRNLCEEKGQAQESRRKLRLRHSKRGLNYEKRQS